MLEIESPRKVPGRDKGGQIYERSAGVETYRGWRSRPHARSATTRSGLPEGAKCGTGRTTPAGVGAADPPSPGQTRKLPQQPRHVSRRT